MDTASSRGGYQGKNFDPNFNKNRGDSTNSYRGQGRNSRSPRPSFSAGENASQNSFPGAQRGRGASRVNTAGSSRTQGVGRGRGRDAPEGGHARSQQSASPPRTGFPNPTSRAKSTFGQFKPTAGQNEEWRKPENWGTPEYTSNMDRLLKQLEAQNEIELKNAAREGRMLEVGKQVTLDKAIPMVGTCEEMAPELERIERIVRNFGVSKLEKTQIPNGQWAPDESKMVTPYRRPDAGKTQSPPSQYRTPRALRATLDYIWNMINVSETYTVSLQKWAWDRTRGLRQDFRIQSSATKEPENAKLCISCFEEIARFHVYNHHVFADPQYRLENYDAQQETEQLVATLVELNEYYVELKSVYQSPNQAEFRAYYILFAWYDPSQSLDFKAASWSQEMLDEPLVQTAFRVREAASNIEQQLGPAANQLGGGHPVVAQGNFVKFFRLLKKNDVSYLMACLAEIQFGKIRFAALKAIWTAYWRSTKTGIPASQRPQIPLGTVVDMLGFDSEEEAATFCELHEMHIENGFVQVTSDSRSRLPEPSLPPAYSKTIVEKKRRGLAPIAVFKAVHPKDAKKAGLVRQDHLDQSLQSVKDTQTSSVNKNPFAAAVQQNPFQQSPGTNGNLPVSNNALSQGLSSNSSTPFGFPAKTASANGLSFGTNTTNSFGAQPKPASPTGPSNISNPFGFPAKAASPTGLSFGANPTNPFAATPKPASANGLSFGANPTNPFDAISKPASANGLSFSTTQPSAGGIGKDGFVTPPSLPTNNPSGAKPNTTLFPNSNLPQGPGQLPSEAGQPPKSFPSVFGDPKPATAPPAQQPLPTFKPLPTPTPLISSKDDEPSLFVPEDNADLKADTPRASLFPPLASQTPNASHTSPFSGLPNAFASTSAASPALSPAPVPTIPPSRKDLFTKLPDTAAATPSGAMPASAPNPFANAKVPESILKAAGTTSAKSPSILDTPNQPGTVPVPALLFPSTSSAKSPMSSAASHGPMDPVVASVQSPPPRPPKPSKKGQLSKLADLLLAGKDGMMQQFLEHEIGGTIEKCMAKFAKEKELKRIADARAYLLAKKYVRRWRELTWLGTLRRRAKKRRTEFAQSMRDLAASCQANKHQFVSPPTHFQPFASLTKPASASKMQPPPKPVGKHKHRASLPADSKLQVQLQQQSERKSGLKPTETSKPQRKSVLGPQRSATAGNMDKIRARASTASLAEETLYTTEQLMRKASRMIKGRTDTTHTDYFKLKALGIDPSTPIIPKTTPRKRPLEDTVDDAARKSRVNPAKAMDHSPHISSLTAMTRPLAASHGTSQSLDGKNHHGALITNGKKDDDDEEFFAQIASIKQRMAEDTAWFRDFREQSERASLERASETPKERKLREWKPSKNRTEARWERDGLPSFLRASWTPRESASRSTSRITDSQQAPDPITNGGKASISQSEEQYTEIGDEDEEEDEDADEVHGQNHQRGYYDADGEWYDDEEIQEVEEEYEEGYADEEDGILDTQAFIAANNNSAFASKGASADDAIEL